MNAVQTYRYLQPSALRAAGLDLQTCGGPAANPRFFAGFLTAPAASAAGLLAVAEVARTRYHQPVNPASLDPVVTGSRGRLRFESFSGCCGVYARMDVLPAGLDGEISGHGTTNVDVNPPLREALAGRHRAAARGGRPGRPDRLHHGRLGGRAEGAAARPLAARLRRGARAHRRLRAARRDRGGGGGGVPAPAARRDRPQCAVGGARRAYAAADLPPGAGRCPPGRRGPARGAARRAAARAHPAGVRPGGAPGRRPCRARGSWTPGRCGCR
ncbi:hypothetical protein V2I01_34710 [Micromonospora sp. BRA006-A]|nr:hypothetical protein [Micromonospora sp. BRA006-A]